MANNVYVVSILERDNDYHPVDKTTILGVFSTRQQAESVVLSHAMWNNSQRGDGQLPDDFPSNPVIDIYGDERTLFYSIREMEIDKLQAEIERNK